MTEKRLFIGFDISDEARLSAAAHIEYLRRRSPGVRVSWERAEKLHVTLKFLGNTSDLQFQGLAGVLHRISLQFGRAELEMSGTGVFPRIREPRILWIGIKEATGMLAKLAGTIDDDVCSLGFEREERTFRPHLTIARVREARNARRLGEIHLAAALEPCYFILSELVLYQSALTPSGSLYSVLSRFPLLATS